VAISLGRSATTRLLSFRRGDKLKEIARRKSGEATKGLAAGQNVILSLSSGKRG